MKHVLSTHLFVNHRLNSVWLDRIQRAGIPAVEIFCAKQHIDWLNRAQVTELGHWFRDSHLECWSMHSPMYNDDVWGRSGPQAVITITEPIKSKRITMVDEIKRALEMAEIIPFRYLIQHIGVGSEEWNERAVDAAFTALEELSIFARQRGVQILLENIPNALASAERLVSFLEQTHLDLGFCFDTGHANLNEGVEAAYDIMKERIRSTHLHDNDGKSDSHLFPFGEKGGTIDWKRALQLLASRPEQYPLLLELKEDPAVAQGIDAAARVFERMEELAASPVEEHR
jgi:sugar phosphate isomerase/epimerase